MNPAFEKNLVKYHTNTGKFKESLTSKLVGQEDVAKVVIQKIQQQWKTIKKSFHDISKDKSGGIT